jgi:hemerythrin-like domain-containing protein
MPKRHQLGSMIKNKGRTIRKKRLDLSVSQKQKQNKTKNSDTNKPTAMCVPTTTTTNSTNSIVDFAQHQKLSEFPPDKESTWPYAKEDDGWMHAHNSIRAEMDLLIAAIDSIREKPLSAAQISYIQQAWQCHYEHVHAHHSNEDDLLVPFLSTRFVYPVQHENDHTALVAKLEALHAMVANLSSSSLSPGDRETGGTTCESLVRALKEYQAMMLPHLAAEEEDSLPLMRAFFTPDEIKPVIQKIAGPPIEVGSFIACMGVETFRTKFMVQEDIPDVLWAAIFQNPYRYYQENFATPLEKLVQIDGSIEI